MAGIKPCFNNINRLHVATIMIYFLIEIVRFSVEPKQVMYFRIKTPMSPGLRLINKCGCAALEFAVANFFKAFNQIL